MTQQIEKLDYKPPIPRKEVKLQQRNTYMWGYGEKTKPIWRRKGQDELR